MRKPVLHLTFDSLFIAKGARSAKFLKVFFAFCAVEYCHLRGRKYIHCRSFVVALQTNNHDRGFNRGLTQLNLLRRSRTASAAVQLTANCVSPVIYRSYGVVIGTGVSVEGGGTGVSGGGTGVSVDGSGTGVSVGGSVEIAVPV